MSREEKRKAEREAYMQSNESLADFANAIRACLDLEPLGKHDGRKK